MIRCKGTYFDGKTSAGRRVLVSFNGAALSVRDDEDGFHLEASPERFDIVPALGRTSRVIRFADGGRMETGDHEAVSDLERVLRKNRKARVVDTLERRWTIALACLAGLVVTVLVVIQFGIPVMVMEGEIYDSRNYSAEQMRTRVETFAEMLREMKRTVRLSRYSS